MVSAKYRWQEENLAPTPASQAIADEFGLATLVAELLVKKGYTTVEEVRRFLEPSSTSFYDPYLLYDMQKTVDRIQEAIVSGEHITIYGDYDADGLTSTAIMYETLTQLGADVDYYIPDRFKDGYGPNKDAYERLIANGTELIVTVDNGVSGHEAITLANEKGVDVLVTDHHELPQTLPDAYAVVHPRHPKGKYPFGDLSGAGVAFKVATALLDEIPQELLDLATIGTVADLVSLTDENRALVKFGLTALENTLRPGLLALYEVAGVDQRAITSETIGFSLGPRLNAIGRMQHAQSGVELLTTLDDELATDLAKEAQSLNIQRQNIVEEITKQALHKLEQEPKHLVNVVAGSDWHEGVLGIVASRLVEKTGRPTLVLDISDEGIAKGSGRSVEDFHLFNALDGHRELMTSFGGHHMACGLALEVSNLSQLQAILDEEAKAQELDLTKKPVLKVSAKLKASEVTLDLIASLDKLAPFGTDNEVPLFEIIDYQVVQAKALGKTNDHLRLDLSTGKTQLAALAFGVGDKLPELLAQPKSLKFVASVDKNEWRGNVSPQLLIKDLAQAVKPKPQVIIERSERLQKEQFLRPALYGFFNANLAQRFADHLPAGSKCVVFDQNLSQLTADEIVLVDLPQNLAQLEFVLSKLDCAKVRAILYTKAKSAPLPERTALTKVYKFIFQVGHLNLKTDLDQATTQVGLEKSQLVLALKMFFEAGFVTIKNGILVGVRNARPHRLEDTNSYRTHGQQIQVEELVSTCSDEELTDWLLQRLG